MIDYLRRLRNEVVHGVGYPDEVQLLDARRLTDREVSKLYEEAPNEVKEIFDETIKDAATARRRR